MTTKMKTWASLGYSNWVKPQHLRRVVCFQEIELTEDYWRAQSWIFNAEQMYIRVTDGRPTRPGPEKEDFSDVVAPNRKNRYAKFLEDYFSQFGYTYVALYIGEVYCRETQERVMVDHHITLGYLGVMMFHEKQKLAKALTRILQEWLTTKPEDRPQRLIQFKRFNFKKEGEEAYDVWDTVTLEELHAQEVEELVTKRLLEEPSYVKPNKIPFLARVRGYHQREQYRLAIAQLRAEKLHKQWGYLRMDRPDNGLGTSGELQDLLEYLADRLTYSPLGYMQDERGKLIVPMITARARWHCSRQSDTMLAEKTTGHNVDWWPQ